MRPRAMAKAGAKAKAKAAVRRDRRLRRPAAHVEAEAGQDPVMRWENGEVVNAVDIPLETLLKAPRLIVEEGSYFHGECQLAGTPTGTVVMGNDLYITLTPTGTKNESILRLQSGAPELSLKLHVCPAGCTTAEVAADLVHIKKVRKVTDEARSEGWHTNLAKAAPMPGGDELAELRARAEEGEGPKPVKDLDKTGDKKKLSKEERKKAKKEKELSKAEKKEKGKERRKRSRSTSSSRSSEDLDGSRPKSCATKTLDALFRGTALDKRDRVRAKVARAAKRSVRKRDKKKASSSGSSGSSTLTPEGDETAESFFLQASRAKGLAESHPGALSNQTLHQMKCSLLQEAGLEGSKRGVEPVALQYYRSILVRKGSGAMMRELYTLSALVGALLRGKPCHALDIATQRMKAVESTLNGVHWTVSQRLEILAQDAQSLAPSQEVREAQKDAYSEQKTRYLAGQPDGRAGKGQEKGKQKGFPGKDPGKKGGKGGSYKGEQGKKKDESTPKA